MLAGCYSNTVTKEEVEGTIESVENGNTIVLSTGTSIRLKGIDENNVNIKKYIESHYLGMEVSLTVDSLDEKEIESYDEDFDAYVTVHVSGDEAVCLNRQLLTVFQDKAFNADFLADSIGAYQQIIASNLNRTVLSTSALSAKMKAASLQIYGANQEGMWLGTAFLINSNGLALTNNHCIEGAMQMTCFLSDGEGNVTRDKQFNIKRVVYRNNEYDFAVLYVDFDEDTRKHLVPLKLTASSFAAGDAVHSVGNPSPDKVLPMRFSSGHISSYNDEDRSMGRIGIDVPITHGFSGGPLCNKYGEVVGINVSGYAHSDANLNFAVDINVVRKALDNLELVYEGK